MRLSALWKRPRKPARLLVTMALVAGTAGSLGLALTNAPVSASQITGCGTVTNCVVSGSPSNFESGDGNMTVENPPASSAGQQLNTDWNCFTNSDNFAKNGAQPPANTCKTTSGATQVTADKSGEVEWVNGQKFDTQCPSLTIGNNPPKDEFTNIASFAETDANLNLWFYGATERQTVNGNASGDVEFDHAAGNGTTTAGCRQAGDKLLAYDFLNGGTSLSFHVLTWVTSGTCFVKTDSSTPNGCWGANVATPAAGDFNGQTNQSLIHGADNGISGTDQQINQFAEFGANLTAVLGLPPCSPIQQEVWESRSSGSSFTSNPEDIEIESQTLNKCGEIKIIKQTDPRGGTPDFQFTDTGLTPSSFKLNDTAGVDTTCPVSSGTCNVQDFLNVPPGSYTVTEGTEPSGYSLEGLTCSTHTNGSTAVQDVGNSMQADINLTSNGLVVCTYKNQALGTINIIKHTSAQGIDQDFSYTSTVSTGTASVPTLGSFTLNDSATNEQTMTNVPAGSYTVTEGTEPTGWTLAGVVCSATGTGSSGAQDAAGSLQSDITLGGGGSVTCTYTNNGPGAIKITKESLKGNTLLQGATFEICTQDPSTHTCVAPASASAGSVTTGPDGTACITGLPWSGSGTTYYLQETSAPTGFAPNTTVYPVAVIQSSSGCGSTATPATQTVMDTPLTDLTITATSEATVGGTSSTITCLSGTSGSGIGTSPQTGGTATVTANGLQPGTYTCTVVVDP